MCDSFRSDRFKLVVKVTVEVSLVSLSKEVIKGVCSDGVIATYGSDCVQQQSAVTINLKLSDKLK